MADNICPHCGEDTAKYDSARVSVEQDEKGRTLTWTEIAEDQDKKQIQKRVDSYTYKNTGEIDVINQKIFNGGNEVINEREIKHSLDGKAPVVTVISSEK